MVKSLITMAHSGKFKYCITVVIYRGILTIENVGTAVNLYSTFTTPAHMPILCINMYLQKGT